MTTINDLKLMNESMIIYLKKLGQSIERNEIIKNILQDETGFKSLTKDDMYIVLEDIGIKEKSKNEIYEGLSIEYQQKIREHYNPDNLFKNRKTQDIIENTEEKSMTVYEEMPLFKRILIKIKEFFIK